MLVFQDHLLQMLSALREYIHDETNKAAIQKTICKHSPPTVTQLVTYCITALSVMSLGHWGSQATFSAPYSPLSLPFPSLHPFVLCLLSFSFLSLPFILSAFGLLWKIYEFIDSCTGSFSMFWTHKLHLLFTVTPAFCALSSWLVQCMFLD